MPQASAIVPGAADAESIAIPANHINMVKFASCEDEGFKKISGHVQLLAEEAPDVHQTALGGAEQDQKGYGIHCGVIFVNIISSGNNKCSSGQFGGRFFNSIQSCWSL